MLCRHLFLRKALCAILAGLFLSCAVPMPSALAKSGPVVTNTPGVFSNPVEVGQTQVEVTLPVQAVSTSTCKSLRR